MRPLVCLAIIFSSWAWADEASDRASIERLISALNTPQRAPGLFTSEFNNFEELFRLGLRVSVSFPTAAGRATPTVVISQEPWGEATLVFPGQIAMAGTPPIIMLEPHASHFTIRSVHLVTQDVAVVDVASQPNGISSGEQSIPALFVMKREGDQWKIASIRLLSQG